MEQLATLLDSLGQDTRGAGPAVPVEPRLLTLAQAAMALGVSTSTAQRMVAEGQLQTGHVSQTPRVPIAQIDQLAYGGQRGA